MKTTRSGRSVRVALGETPNIAARLQGLAAPDTVVISEATAQLIQGYFVCQALGAQVLKGLAQPLMVSRVLHESGAQTRLDVAATRGLTLPPGGSRARGRLAGGTLGARHRRHGPGRLADGRSGHWQVPPCPGPPGSDRGD